VSPYTEHQTRRRRGLSERMKRDAIDRQCPKCGRKSALKILRDDDLRIKCCRWDDCDFEKGGFIRNL